MELSFESGRFVAYNDRLNYQEVLDDFPNANIIRIITYNISKNKRSDSLLEALKESTADIKLITNVPSRMDESLTRWNLHRYLTMMKNSARLDFLCCLYMQNLNIIITTFYKIFIQIMKGQNCVLQTQCLLMSMIWSGYISTLMSCIP